MSLKKLIKEVSDFDHPDRKGADALHAAGYVEEADYEKDVMDKIEADQPVSGYFCYTCEYCKHVEGTLKGGWCTLLKAEDAPHGCCNKWEKK